MSGLAKLAATVASSAVHHGRFGAVAALLVLGTGCGIDLEFEYLEGGPPTHGFVEADGIEVALGTAVGVRVTDGGDHFEEGTAITMASDDPHILAIAASTAHDEFVVWGVAPGTTHVTVDIDGAIADGIPAMVVAP